MYGLSSSIVSPPPDPPVGRSSSVSCSRMRSFSCCSGRPGSTPSSSIEDRSGLAVGGECFRRSLGPVERQHPLRPEVLAEGPRPGQVVELADQLGVTPQREVGVDPSFGRAETLLVEPRDLADQRGFIGEVGERRAAPQVECAPVEGGGPGGVGHQGPWSRGRSSARTRGRRVRPGPTTSRYPAVPPLEAIRAHHLAQVRDVGLQGTTGPPRADRRPRRRRSGPPRAPRRWVDAAGGRARAAACGHPAHPGRSRNRPPTAPALGIARADGTPTRLRRKDSSHSRTASSALQAVQAWSTGGASSLGRTVGEWHRGQTHADDGSRSRGWSRSSRRPRRSPPAPPRDGPCRAPRRSSCMMPRRSRWSWSPGPADRFRQAGLALPPMQVHVPRRIRPGCEGHLGFTRPGGRVDLCVRLAMEAGAPALGAPRARPRVGRARPSPTRAGSGSCGCAGSTAGAGDDVEWKQRGVEQARRRSSRWALADGAMSPMIDGDRDPQVLSEAFDLVRSRCAA